MTPGLESLGTDKLSVEEKFELIDAIVDSFASEVSDDTLTDA